MSTLVYGFEPFFNSDSLLLVLGSFPSVKSREQQFYYGNRQNAFWPILAEYFCQPLPADVQQKKQFLTANKIALWDIVTSCEIAGSADSSISNYTVADLNKVLPFCPVKKIILNGGMAYKIFLERYSGIAVPYVRLPSTSPANAHPKKEVWLNELRATFN